MKYKSTIILTTLVLAIIGTFVWGYFNKSSTSSVQGVSSDKAHSALAAAETFYDFGQISMKNGDVQKDFVINNPTGTDIFIPRVATSCMCTKAYIVEADGSAKGPFGMLSMGYVPPANETIKPGESKIIRVVYDPNAHGPAGIGPIDRFISVTDANGGVLQLEIKALVTP